MLSKNGPFLDLHYVCPEPVLVKYSFLHMNGSKRTFLLTVLREEFSHTHERRRCLLRLAVVRQADLVAA